MQARLQYSEAAGNGFFKKTFFLQNPILELSNYTVPVKGVASPILTDNKLLQGHFLKFGDSIQ